MNSEGVFRNSPAIVCLTCARWIVYPCIVGALKTEATRCMNGVIDAGRRTECSCYLREPGSEPW